MSKASVIAIIIMLSSFFLNAQENTLEKAPHKVVIQLSSSDTLAWKMLMNNIKNIKAVWEDKVTIEVIANGPGLNLLMKEKTTQSERIIFFKTQGVTFMACENTLKERNISKESIIPEAGYVKSAVVDIMLKQEQGWSYIKGGF
jgi:intracellular sulfur oxidation DsrE/DsrF family protein